MAIGTGAFTFFGYHTSLALVTLMYCLRMLGNSFLLMPLTAYGMSVLDKKYISHGTAILNSIRQMGGALGSSILVAIMGIASASTSSPDVHGVNISFAVQTVIIIIGLLLTLLFIKGKQRPTEQKSGIST